MSFHLIRIYNKHYALHVEVAHSATLHVISLSSADEQIDPRKKPRSLAVCLFNDDEENYVYTKIWCAVKWEKRVFLAFFLPPRENKFPIVYIGEDFSSFHEY